MLAKKNRLNRQEIDLLKKAKTEVIQGRFFGLVYQPADQAKFGVIVSNKIVSKAVRRNQVKRRLYLAIRNINWEKPGQFLFLAKKTAVEASLLETEEEVKEILKKIGNKQ